MNENNYDDYEDESEEPDYYDNNTSGELTGCLSWNENSLNNYRYYKGYN